LPFLGGGGRGEEGGRKGRREAEGGSEGGGGRTGDAGVALGDSQAGGDLLAGEGGREEGGRAGRRRGYFMTSLTCSFEVSSTRFFPPSLPPSSLPPAPAARTRRYAPSQPPHFLPLSHPSSLDCLPPPRRFPPFPLRICFPPP
ncbi:hypothetical protein Naga_103181g1, partial [Nannochloropsis gaditana]